MCINLTKERPKLSQNRRNLYLKTVCDTKYCESKICFSVLPNTHDNIAADEFPSCEESEKERSDVIRRR